MLQIVLGGVSPVPLGQLVPFPPLYLIIVAMAVYYADLET